MQCYVEIIARTELWGLSYLSRRGGKGPSLASAKELSGNTHGRHCPCVDSKRELTMTGQLVVWKYGQKDDDRSSRKSRGSHMELGNFGHPRLAYRG